MNEMKEMASRRDLKQEWSFGGFGPAKAEARSGPISGESPNCPRGCGSGGAHIRKRPRFAHHDGQHWVTVMLQIND
jgi:hypothetical protein